MTTGKRETLSPRKGSATATKQLLRTVTEGRKVVFHQGAQTVEGYLCGMDDFNYFVVTDDNRKALVHKAGAVVFLADHSTYEGEVIRTELEKVVGPFRDWINDTNYGKTEEQAS